MALNCTGIIMVTLEGVRKLREHVLSSKTISFKFNQAHKVALGLLKKLLSQAFESSICIQIISNINFL